MSIQTIIRNNLTQIMITSASDKQLIQEDDPLLSFIPNLKDLRCNQIHRDCMTVRATFFQEILNVGNATSDLIIDPANGLSTVKTINLSEYLSKKRIDRLIAQESPENQQILKVAVKRFFMGLLALMTARNHHYTIHSGDVDRCKGQIRLLSDLFCQAQLSKAKALIDQVDFASLDTDVTSLAFKVSEIVKKPDHLIHGSDQARQQFALRNRYAKRKAKEHSQEFHRRFDLINTFTTLLSSPEALFRLAESTFYPERKGAPIYEVVEQIIREKQRKQADENADNLLKQLEEESKKTSRTTQTSKKSTRKPTSSSRQASASSSSHLSNVKQLLAEQTAHPKERTETSDLGLLRDLERIVIGNLSLHFRIKRWAKTTPDTIKDIKDWDKKENRWIFPYEKDPSPGYTIASHDLSLIVRLLRSKLAETYAQPYSFVDTENNKRKGWALVADMRWEDKEQQ